MADEAAEPVKKKSKKKFIFILLLLLILLGGGGYAAYHFGMADMVLGMFSGNATEEPEPAGEDGEAAPAVPATTVTVQPFVVNLANPVGSKLVRLSMDLEMIDAKSAEQLNQEMVKVRDSIILLLSSKTYADLAPMEGKLQLKSEIVERVNLILGGPKVVKVYFTDMIFQ